MRISDWSSDVCSSDLILQNEMGKLDKGTTSTPYMRLKTKIDEIKADPRYAFMFSGMLVGDTMASFLAKIFRLPSDGKPIRSEEHTSELQSLMRISYAVFCLKKKNNKHDMTNTHNTINTITNTQTNYAQNR